ncbi:MAG: phosphate--acyl-ACP acyltransferase, partial [Elusimicrobia bacterium]|nr:phosphate--acyl-ACP acyltransferase [Elusimicrobiota bacterium]
MVKIALDAMGGDTPPAPNIDGAIAALKAEELGGSNRKEKIEIVLVGDKALLEEELSKRGASNLPIEIKDASEVIGMDENPILACRQKPDSSIVVGMNVVASGQADGFVSAGNSGAVMAAAVMHLEKLKGVSRPAIATPFPTMKDPCLLVDVGANADCKSKHLYQFALMGEAYVKYIFKRRIPRVGLLSMG